MKNKDKHYTAFNDKWFEKNQQIVLFVFRIIYKLFPSLLFKSQETKDFGNKKIVKVGTNYATCLVNKERRELKTVFFTDWNYSKMLYNAFKPIWWAMHYWDELVADKWAPSLSFGFDTLEFNPAAGANSPVDGYVGYNGSGADWATVRNGAGGLSGVTDVYQYCWGISSAASSNNWNWILRSIFIFDTSTLTSSANISEAVLSLYGNAKLDNLGITPDTNIYTSTPASNNNLVNGDYTQLGTVAQCDTAITYAGFSTAGYNNFTFNVTGRGNISKIGISKFGARNANYDVANSAPAWSASLWSYIYIWFADNGSLKPKLVVTYTLASGGEAGLLLRNCQ